MSLDHALQALWPSGLKAVGVGADIDDLGAGYSSPSYLHEFHLVVLRSCSDVPAGCAARQRRQALEAVSRRQI